MTTELLLDTHIALWLESGDARLRPETIRRIETCWRAGGTLLLSAVSVWEIAQLIFSGRIELNRPMAEWLEQFLGQPGKRCVPLGHRAAMGAYWLHELEHRDPADRLLIATSIEHACPMVTYDQRIAHFAERHGSRYGFSVAT